MSFSTVAFVVFLGIAVALVLLAMWVKRRTRDEERERARTERRPQVGFYDDADREPYGLANSAASVARVFLKVERSSARIAEQPRVS